MNPTASSIFVRRAFASLLVLAGANVAAAEALEKRRWPCMYRVHDQPDATRIEALREFLIARVPVREGHWLLTGTPAGVGPLRAGDELAASLTTADGTSVLQTNWTVHPPK